MKVEQLVAFCVLMEADGDILGKSPSYILEKFKYCEGTDNPKFLEGVLDRQNLAKFGAWMEKWMTKRVGRPS